MDGQVKVISTAQALAGVDARSIGFGEAHGTATPLGDAIECEAVDRCVALLALGVDAVARGLGSRRMALPMAGAAGGTEEREELEF